MATIETKFGLGDVVWGIDQAYRNETCESCGRYHTVGRYWKICDIEQVIVGVAVKEGDVRYWMDHQSIYDLTWLDCGREADCFATKEEAHAECGRRNREAADE